MTNACFPVFGRLALFGAALAVPAFASLSLSAETIDLTEKPQTTDLTTNVTDSYTTSGPETETLPLKPGAKRTFTGAISGNTHVHIKGTNSYAYAQRYYQFKNATWTHTGGTTLEGLLWLYGSETFAFGTQPIDVYNSDTANVNGAVKLTSTRGELTNTLIFKGEKCAGYQTSQANIQGKIENGKTGTVTFSGDIDAQDVGGINIHQGNEYKTVGSSQMVLSGTINASGSDVYLTCASNAVMSFTGDMTAKRLRCAYYSDGFRLGTIKFGAGKNYTFDTFELAGHFVNMDGNLNAGCVLSFVPVALNADGGSTSIAEAVGAAEYADGTAYVDPEISKMTFGADQTVNCVTGAALTPAQAAQPGMVLTGTDKTLTLKCAQSLAECSAKVSGSLGLTLDATEKSNCQAFLARANDTTGAITVEKGVFRIGAGASFANVTSVSVGADGTLEIASLEEDPISSGAELSLATGAGLTIADGAALTVARVLLDGEQVTKADALKVITFKGIAAAFTVLDEPMAGTFFYGAASVSLTSKTGWYTDRELTTPSGAAPAQSDDPDKPNVYIVCDGHKTAKVAANTTFAGDVLQLGDPETAGNAEFNSGTTTIGSCRVYGGTLELNNDGTLYLEGDYELYKGTADIVFRDSYISTSERKIAFSGSFAAAEDVAVTLTGLYGSGVKVSTGLDYKSGSMIVDGDFSAFKGSLVAQTPKYSGDNIHLPFYVELTSTSAFGDTTCERADALVLGNECVLRLGPDVVSSAARGITLNLKAEQAAQIDTSKYGDVVLNAPLAGATGTVEKIGAGKLTLTGACGVGKILVSSGSLRLEKTVTFPKGTTVEVDVGATVYYWEEQLQQGLELTGSGNRRPLGQGLVLILE